MEIVELKAGEAPTALRLIKSSFIPLLDKYKDVNHSPATKSLDRLLDEINHPISDTYLLKNPEDTIGYVRVNKRSIAEYSITDLCIDPAYQGNGYAQFFLKELEKKYHMAKKWSLVTILEEEKDCYLYEKLGYSQIKILEEISPEMHFVLYVKEK